MQVVMIVIDPSGDARIECAERPSLAQLQAWVGGCIEGVTFPDLGLHGFINEEGKLDGLPINVPATELWHASHTSMRYPPPRDVLVGSVVIFGGVDGNGNSIGLDNDQVEFLIDEFAVREVKVA